MPPRATAILLALSLVGGALLVAPGQLLTPLHLLTHETTQGFTAMAGLVWLWVAWALARRHGEQLLWTALAGAQLTGLGALLLLLSLGGPVYGCQSELGAIFFAATWVPVGVLVVVLGLSAGRAGWSRKRLVLAVLVVVALLGLNALVQELRGLRIMDPLLGAPMFVIQRASLDMTGVEGAQRLWLLGVAVLLWPVLRWRSAPRPALIAGAMALVVTLLGGSHLGLGWGRGALEGLLDGEVHSDHFTIRYDRSGRGALYADTVATEAEFYRAALARDWDLPEDARVEIRLYEGSGQVHEATGIYASHAGPGWLDLTVNHAVSSTLSHELVHALHIHLWPHPTVAINRGMLEGTAMAWELGLSSTPLAHQDAAATLANGDLPHAWEFMSPLGFWVVEERAAYYASGSFVGWLVLEHGADDFMRLQRTMDWEEVYGADLHELDAAWRDFLRGIPVDLDARAAARERFDRDLHPGYTSRACPKVGARDLEPQERADRLVEAGDHASAAQLYQDLYAEKGKPRWARLALASLVMAGELGQAREVLALATQDELEPDQEAALLEEALRLHLAAGELSRVDPLLLRLDTLGETSFWQELGPLLRDPDLGEEVRDMLLADTDTRRVVALIRLQAAHPDDPRARALYLRDGGVILPVGWRTLGLSTAAREEAWWLLDQVQATPDTCDALAEELVVLGQVAARLDERALAQGAVLVLQSQCGSPEAVVGAQHILERLDWEAP